MSKPRHPVTPAIRALRAAKVEFEPHLYDYVSRGGTSASSAALGVPEGEVIKTLVFLADGEPIVVLMPGDQSVASGRLSTAAGAKKTVLADPKTAQKHSGYLVGGTSPFGLKRPMRIYAGAAVEALEHLYINGGKRGFLVRLARAELDRVLSPCYADVGC